MFTREKLRSFRKDFDDAVKHLERKYEMKLDVGNISFTAESFTVRITGSKANEFGEKIVDPDKFRRSANLVGYKGELGFTYYINSTTYTVIDIDLKKPRNCMILKCNNGSTYKASAATVNRYVDKFAKTAPVEPTPPTPVKPNNTPPVSRTNLIEF